MLTDLYTFTDRVIDGEEFRFDAITDDTHRRAKSPVFLTKLLPIGERQIIDLEIRRVHANQLRAAAIAITDHISIE